MKITLALAAVLAVVLLAFAGDSPPSSAIKRFEIHNVTADIGDGYKFQLVLRLNMDTGKCHVLVVTTNQPAVRWIEVSEPTSFAPQPYPIR